MHRYELHGYVYPRENFRVKFPGISGKCRENSRRENFRGKFPGNSGKFREIPGKFPTGKFPGKLSGKIPGKFIFSSAEFIKIREIG